MKKTILVMLGFLLMGCSDNQDLAEFGNTFKSAGSRFKPATIDTSEYKNSRLRINGSCGDEGQILLVLPTTKGDNRIIGSPTCKNGRYELITATFGRPPCGVVVEYGGSKNVQARVAGTDIYCQ